MKNISLSHVVISLLFIIILATPMLVSVTSDTETVSKAEKRKLAQFPEFTFSTSTLKTFPKEFEDYVDDHFGFRSQIVKKHNYTLCKIFKVSPSSMVTIGSDNWYFFNGDAAIHDYLGKIKFTDEQLAKTSRLLEDRQEWLDSLEIKYLFLPIPNKEPIYEEHLPYALQLNRGRSKYEQILGFTNQHSSFKNYIDVQQLLLEHKSENQLYLKTDSHWNHDGTYIVYREIIQRMQEWFPDITPIELNSEKAWVDDFSGDLANLMNLRGLVTEKAPDINIIQSCETKKTERLTSIKKLEAYKNLPNARLPITGGCEKKKYKVLFIHDSFGKFLRPYFSQQFETVIFVNYLNFEVAKALIKSEKPDIVIDQRVGRNLEKALILDPQLEQTVLKMKFDRLTTILHQDNFNKAQLPKESSVELPLNSSETQHTPSILKLDVTADNATELSICYINQETNAKQCEKRKITSGSDEFFTRILKPSKQAALEITADPPVAWAISSYTVKAGGA